MMLKLTYSQASLAEDRIRSWGGPREVTETKEENIQET